jgi:DNA-binding GntR family transcriptional regulator
MMVGKPAKPATGRSTKAAPMPSSTAREPAAAIIAKRIEEDIVLGRRQPRERLVIPNRGAMVRGLTPVQVTEIYAVREELEVMAVRIIPFPVAPREIGQLEELQRQHTAAIAAGDLLTVFYSNLSFHRVLYGLCGNACLIETIDLLAQKVYGIRSYANAFPKPLDRARRDHVDMIKALRGSRRDELIALTRRHLKPSPEAYIKAYERRFGKAD